MASSTASSSSRMRRASARYCAPRSVTRTKRVVRVSSFTRKRSSRSATARVTAGGDSARRRAAAAKLRSSATATNTFMTWKRSITLFLYMEY